MHSFTMNELCSVIIGYRPKSGSGGGGDDLGIAISDLDQSRGHVDAFPVPAHGRLWLGDLEVIDADTRKSDYYLREGDILFLSRGQRRIAVPIAKEYVQPWPPDFDRTIVLYYFFILRPKSDRIRAEYLAWAINEGPLKPAIDAMAEGSVVQKVSVRDFRDMKVDVPPMEVQNRLVKLYELSVREQRLHERLAVRRREYAASICSLIHTQQLRIGE